MMLTFVNETFDVYSAVRGHFCVGFYAAKDTFKVTQHLVPPSSQVSLNFRYLAFYCRTRIIIITHQDTAH